MLLCVCLNPALDVTYELDDAVRPGASHRVRTVRERAGGKGVNVARVLGQLGSRATVLGFAGGPTGETMRSRLGDLDAEFVDVAGPTRRTLVVLDPEGATAYNEPGPAVPPEALDELHRRYADLLGRAEAVVLSGSVPPGVPPGVYATLTAVARRSGVPVVLDADGPFLELALAAGPSLVKPNLAELERFAGGPATGEEWVLAQGHRLRARGPDAVVVSLGGDGLVALTGEGDWRARGPEVLDGNPTGAGDALVAALTLGRVSGRPWPEVLRDAVATSAAAVARPVAGEIDPAVRARTAPAVVVSDVASARTGPRSTTPFRMNGH